MKFKNKENMNNTRNQLMSLYLGQGFDLKLITVHDTENFTSWQVLKIWWKGKFIGGHRFKLNGEMIHEI